MNETRFRALLREAVGEEPMRPWLNEAVRARIAEPRPRTFAAAWVGFAAACLAAAIVVVAVAPRLLNHAAPVLPAATPSSGPTPATAFGCTLPVLVGANVPGYIDTKTGEFRRDNAGTAGLPGGAAARGYDSVPHRWVPVPLSWISPDGQSYAYTIQDSTAQTVMHIYRLDTGSDKVVLTGSAGIFIRAWLADGIHFTTENDNGGTEHVLVLATGQVAGGTLATDRFTPLPGDPHGTVGGAAFTRIGYTADGRPIFWFYNLDAPTQVDWVFYETAPGVRVYIYKGSMGDATGFAPGTALADSHGIWFSDYHARSLMWHWDASTGLRTIPLASIPDGVDVVPAGPCF